MEELAIRVLKFCAWVNLVVFIAAAITNLPGIAQGVILALAGVGAWAFLLVVCSMAESLIEIRTNTPQPAKSRLFDREAR